MAGGVFDRHPGLKLALTEVRADWVPATIAHLDERMTASRMTTSRMTANPAARSAAAMKLKPSEYYRRHIVVAPSSIHRAEVEMRQEIGVAQLLFGADYPHPEGTWPNTREWIRNAFDGVPEDEVRQILGENAVATYGLDGDLLAKVAARIGPSSEILTDGWVDESLVRHFDQRAGYRRAAETVNLGALDAVLDADLVTLGA
jgi:predicted TIM-barrel fold metal-dependent hydrolase